MNPIDPAESVPRVEIAACAGCGRLMADETGPLCERCSTDMSAATTQRDSGMNCWATWGLFAVTTVASAVGLGFTREQFPVGACFGPDAAAGEWWRLLTAILVHGSFSHYLVNMIPFVFFGRKLERILGHWSFLAFYLVCGVTGGMVSMYHTPEVHGAGASGAIFGICGGLIAHYALRWRGLSRRQWIKFGVLVAFTGLGAWPYGSDPTLDWADHLGGLLCGLLLGFVLCTGFAQRPARRGWIFAAAIVLLATSAAAFRQRNLYLIHIHTAANALQDGQPEVAAGELKTALAMKPDSAVGMFLVHKLQQDRPSEASCRSLPLAPDHPHALQDPCAVLQCDGRLHAVMGANGTTIGWRSATSDSAAMERDGVRLKEFRTRVVMQALDEFGQIACTVAWERKVDQPVDSDGRPIGNPTSTAETVDTLSEFDPDAVAIRNAARRAKGE